MADQKVVEFLQAAEQNPALRARVKAVEVSDRRSAFTALCRIAESEGYSVTAEALESALREFMPRELSEDQLEAVTGGSFPCNGFVATSWNDQSLSFASMHGSVFSDYFAMLETKAI